MGSDDLIHIVMFVAYFDSGLNHFLGREYRLALRDIVIGVLYLSRALLSCTSNI
jgi:hypothetical protein